MYDCAIEFDLSLGGGEARALLQIGERRLTFRILGMSDIQAKLDLAGYHVAGAGQSLDFSDRRDESLGFPGVGLGRKDQLGGGAKRIGSEIHRYRASMARTAQ